MAQARTTSREPLQILEAPDHVGHQWPRQSGRVPQRNRSSLPLRRKRVHEILHMRTERSTHPDKPRRSAAVQVLSNSGPLPERVLQGVYRRFAFLALELNRKFQEYLRRFGDLQQLIRPVLQELAEAKR